MTSPVGAFQQDAGGGRGFRAYFFGRAGGVSEGPCASLNLGVNAGDLEHHRVENERRVLAAMRAHDLYLPTQVHGSAVCQAETGAGVVRGAPADAVLITTPGHAVGILTADCVPVLVAEAEGRRAAAIHAGWRGLAAGVIATAVRELDAPGGRLLAFVGPAIGPCCYEVDAELARRFRESVAGGAGAAMERAGRFVLDLPGVAFEQLREAGIETGNIRVMRRWTACEAAVFFSHRRDRGATGRQVSAIVLGA